ncbi:DUF4047 domain-containing protein [Peribacillus alkalitolerans]|uniref:DUF4047 domain-containing protein n=1 Tax=Peribacillus alkalitolerans TaxID=1550385 RepID=UPI0013D09DE9|nr:DUF4047 domain-containing protein [Peribacillus alkalitolerans]
MKAAFHKAIILPCICCISFYTGVQLVGETEASFSRQASLETIEMSAAFVFPSTIKLLENKAKTISISMHNKHESITPISPDASLQELQEKQIAITHIEQDLSHLLKELESIHLELDSYSQKAAGNQAYDYVHEGYKNVDRLVKEVQATIDMQHLSNILSTISSKIKELEEKALEKQKTQDEESASGDLVEGAIKHEEEEKNIEGNL